MNKTQEVSTLIDKASKSHSSIEALQFSQAACNAANAMCSLGTALKTEGSVVIRPLHPVTDKESFAQCLQLLTLEGKKVGLDTGQMVEALYDEAGGLENDSDPQ